MDVNKNSYTFIFAFVMVVVVAAILSAAAEFLRPAQDENVRLEKMQSILASINVEVERDAADDAYQKHIKEEIVLTGGDVNESVNAFTIDLSKEIPKIPMLGTPLSTWRKRAEKLFTSCLCAVKVCGDLFGVIFL